MIETIVINEEKVRGDERGTWSSKTEFVLSCMGYAIGIGNVWRFPYLCYRNGGGAFLVPYLLMLFLCGIPLFYLELNLGQFSGSGCITIFKIAPILKGAGYAMIVVNVICSCYYIIIITYPLVFMVKSFGTILPWESCNNSWNTENCMPISDFTNLNDSMTTSVFKTPANEFFHNEILHISSGISTPGNFVWSLLVGDVFVCIVMFLCLMKGIKSVGKVVYFTATFPFLILGVLFVRGITLPGAMEGIRFYITPQWSELLNLKVWADAAVQIFFSLGPGWGGIINMASYNKFNNKTKWDSIVIPIVNCGTSIFAGFVVFSVLGFMSERTGISVATVATSGPGLAFVTYPEAIAMLPFPNLWAVLFFFMLFLLGIDSCLVQMEAVITAIIDEYPSLHCYQRRITIGSIFVIFLGSIPCITQGGMYVIQLLDWYAASISVILICLVEVFVVSWTYGASNFIRDVEFMTGSRPGAWWYLCWKYITPLILVLIFITTIVFNTEISYNETAYPSWAICIGWGSCWISIICIPIYFALHLNRLKGSLSERIRTGLTAVNFHPNNAVDQQRYIELLDYTKHEKFHQSSNQYQ